MKMLVAVEEMIGKPGSIMDRMAGLFVSHGHGLIRWRSQEDDGCFDANAIGHADLVVAWEGRHHRPGFSQIRHVCRVGDGWSSPDAWVADIAEIGVFAPWSLRPAKVRGDVRQHDRVSVGPGHLLVVGEDHVDDRMRRFSPWFGDTDDLVRFLCGRTRREIVLIDHSRVTSSHLAAAAAVATINHPLGMRAVSMGRPVLSYGHSFYRHPRVVACLDDTGDGDPMDADHGITASSQKAFTALATRHEWGPGNCEAMFTQLVARAHARIKGSAMGRARTSSRPDRPRR